MCSRGDTDDHALDPMERNVIYAAVRLCLQQLFCTADGEVSHEDLAEHICEHPLYSLASVRRVLDQLEDENFLMDRDGLLVDIDTSNRDFTSAALEFDTTESDEDAGCDW